MPSAAVLNVSHLLAVRAEVRWPEALALVQQIAASSAAGTVLAALRLDGEGRITAVPPASADRDAGPAESPVHALAGFLRPFIPPPDANPQPPVPPGLRYTVVRALGGVTAPPFQSLAEFSQALTRFEQGDRATLLQGLFERMAGRVADAEADLRREDANANLEARVTPLPLATAYRHDEEDRRPDDEPDAADHEAPAARWDELPLRPEPRVAPPIADAARDAARPRANTRRTPRRQKAAGPLLTAAAALSILMAAAVVSAAVVITVQGPQSPVLDAIRPQIERVREFLGAGNSAMPGEDAASSGADASVPPARDGKDAGTTRDGGPESETAGDGTGTGASLGEAATPGGAKPGGAALGTAGATPLPPRPRDPVAPDRSDNAGSESLDAPGRLVEALDVGNRPVFSPSFAADGSAIFFQQDQGSNGSALKEARPAGGARALRILSVLDDGAKNYHPHLSPDGTTVAFDSDRDGVRGVYLSDRDGHNIRRVSGEGYAAVPTWSPDGRRIAFVKAEADNPRVWNVWALDVASGVAQRLTSHRVGQPWGASWFPDGRRICYSHEDELIVLDTVSGVSRSYPSPRKGRLVRTPAVSPDGRYAVFQVYRDGGWLIDFGDGTTRKVLDDQTAEEFAWSPDGTRVAFHSRRDRQWGIWVAGLQ